MKDARELNHVLKKYEEMFLMITRGEERVLRIGNERIKESKKNWSEMKCRNLFCEREITKGTLFDSTLPCHFCLYNAEPSLSLSDAISYLELSNKKMVCYFLSSSFMLDHFRARCFHLIYET